MKTTAKQHRSFRRLVVVAGAIAAYATLVRPRILRWGAFEEEVAADYPGRDIVPGGRRISTMATTLDAPPEQVWPWLVQMGLGRGGWYSWDHLDNWGHVSAEEIHPEWQQLEVGSRLSTSTDGSTAFVVAAIEPKRFLALRASLDLRAGREFDPDDVPRPRYFTDSTWCFQLTPFPGGKTRLVVSGYATYGPRWLARIFEPVVFEPAHWIMQRRQFRNLRRLTAHAPARPSVAEATKTVL
ncbi:hypothetical protein [Gordonia rhizosphera]|uniref:START domain-containing protein n=1 Tax=Gordonia rhizosphera NBRC 16068 TaxID=1108045 RepID=K6WA92_9ACTN|nr:hypothetical protein [Gordonia rhizosphera]GAB89122.1 hypothetical protein GORHZ_050_00390 [Gordonia rhizosphera NBRC 16068]